MYWGFVLAGTTDVKVYRLKAPMQFEVTWSSRGRMAKFDPRGEREPLYEAYAAVRVLQHRLGDQVAFRPDTIRRMGQFAERWLARSMIGALEIELPKQGEDAGRPWRLRNPPPVARGWVQGQAASAVNLAVAGRAGTDATLTWSGTVSEMPGSLENSVMDYAIQTAVQGNVAYDLAAGRVKSQHMSLRRSSTQAIYGFVARDVDVSPWSEGDSAAPVVNLGN